MKSAGHAERGVFEDGFVRGQSRWGAPWKRAERGARAVFSLAFKMMMPVLMQARFRFRRGLIGECSSAGAMHDGAKR